MSKERLFLDVHVIQTIPPSNINRDDTGSPKTAQYGGVKRTRVSSQAWKRAMRKYFLENGNKSNVGVRTKDIVSYLANKIIKLKNEINIEDAMGIADKIFNEAGVKTKDQKSKALFFLGDKQAENLAKLALEENYKKETLKEVLSNHPAIDIALFGRMVADDPMLNEDASSQIAHAISTHGIQNEFDFFTAADDLSPDDNAGAGMLGTIEYNSSTLYRYGNIALHELKSQLNDSYVTINSVKLFVEAFSNSMPTGKINTFANQTFPQFIAVSLRKDRPVNLVSAFETPIKSNDGYVNKSIDKLAEEFIKSEKFVEKPLLTIYLSLNPNEKMVNYGQSVDSLQELLALLGTEVEKYIL